MWNIFCEHSLVLQEKFRKLPVQWMSAETSSSRLQGDQYWSLDGNLVMEPGYPKPLATEFPGLTGNISAALAVPATRNRPETVYFFKNGEQDSRPQCTIHKSSLNWLCGCCHPFTLEMCRESVLWSFNLSGCLLSQSECVKLCDYKAKDLCLVFQIYEWNKSTCFPCLSFRRHSAEVHLPIRQFSIVQQETKKLSPEALSSPSRWVTW